MQWLGPPAALVLWGYAAAQALTDTAKRPGFGDRLGIAVFCIGLGLAFALVLYRMGRSKLIVSNDDVVVVNPIRRYSVARSDVSAIGVSPGASWAMLRTRTGKRIPVFALSSGFKWSLRRRMNEVNATLGFDR
ncbi:MAG: PH domain-containing protein [Mycobacterium sp.]|nr:PH domain-containing protein [Mycobacterium sp.]